MACAQSVFRIDRTMDLSDFNPEDVARARDHVLRASPEPLRLDFVIGDLGRGVSVVPVERWPAVQHSDVAEYLDRGLSWGWIQSHLEEIRALRDGRIDQFQLQLDDNGAWAFREGIVGFVALHCAGPPKGVHTLDDLEKAFVDLAEAQLRHYAIALERRESVRPALEILDEGGRTVVREADGRTALARVDPRPGEREPASDRRLRRSHRGRQTGAEIPRRDLV